MESKSPGDFCENVYSYMRPHYFKRIFKYA